MLDIRATHYVSPLSEVDFTDVALTVHLVNAADEAGLITGRFRVYNDTTGELIFDSQIAPMTLTAGQSADVSALTDFSPPAPLDDTYFVIFDGNASNYLVPHGIPFVLSAFYFDVKPGPLGDPPEAHAPTHEQAGADPIETADLGTTELDTALRLAPDGAGGVAWTPGFSDIDHGTLSGLADDDHPQYQLRHEVRAECEFFGNQSTYTTPWAASAAAGGTANVQTSTPDHPGILNLSSSVSANSGITILLLVRACLSLEGSEVSILWFRPFTLAGTTRHHGFHDANSVTDPVDGVWIWQDPATGIIYGRTRSNSVGSTTGTGYQLVTNTWYCEKIVVNADATRVDFYLYDEAGTLLWTDFLTTNIPTAAGRELGHGVVATNSGTTAVSLVDLDYMKMLIPDRRPDL